MIIRYLDPWDRPSKPQVRQALTEPRTHKVSGFRVKGFRGQLEVRV